MAEHAYEVLEKTGVFTSEEIGLIVNKCLSETAKKDIELICGEPKILAWFRKINNLKDAAKETKEMWWYGFFSAYEKRDKELRKPGEEALWWSRVDAAREYVRFKQEEHIKPGHRNLMRMAG